MTWIRSKYEGWLDGSFINEPININAYRSITCENEEDCVSREVNQFRILFHPAYMVGDYDLWDYCTEEERNQEYELIMSILDCVQNDGKLRTPNIDRAVRNAKRAKLHKPPELSIDQ